MEFETFEAFMEAVDQALVAAVGLTSEDLRDYDYAGCYEADTPVDEVAELVLAENGYSDPKDRAALRAAFGG